MAIKKYVIKHMHKQSDVIQHCPSVCQEKAYFYFVNMRRFEAIKISRQMM